MTEPSMARDIFLKILGLLFPPACLSCARITGLDSLPLGLCSECRHRLEPAQGNGWQPTGQGTSPLSHVLSCWSYQPPLDTVIRALKYGRLEYLADDLADGLHRSWNKEMQELDVIVPIPLHWMRLRARGFNQAQAIARPLARRLRIPTLGALRRRRRTMAQTGLDRTARVDNLRRAFAVRARARSRVEGRRILLVDDVVTTGATLEAAASCLQRAGAARVVGATCAATPPGRSASKKGRRAPLTGVI